MINPPENQAAQGGAASDYETQSWGNSTAFSNYQLEEECLYHMRLNELSPDRSLVADGRIHRFSIDANKKKKDEWYVGHSWGFQGRNYLTVSYGSWSNPDVCFRYESWKQQNLLSDQEKEHLKRRIQELDRQVETEREKKREEASAEAQAIWSNALKEPEHGSQKAYLVLKGIKAFNARFGENPQGFPSILLPLWNIKGEIRSLQFISVKQSEKITYKTFLAGGEKKGCFFVMGNLKNENSFIVSEGYSTAASIHESDGRPVVVAFDCGNLEPVISVLRAKYPDKEIIIAGDDDTEDDLRKKYEDLQAGQKCRLDKLWNDRYEQQLEAHLDNYQIAKAEISGIGPGRKATLQSYGIETAADIKRYKLRIDGFGPKLVQRLVDWKIGCGKVFRFDPAKEISQQEVQGINRDISSKCYKLELDLSRGVEQLKKATDQIHGRHRQLYIVASKVRADYAQVLANALEVGIEV